MNKNIGVFDSGLGGLTVVKQLKKILPEENIIYFGDTARIPYGSKSKSTIYRYTEDNIEFLLSKDVKIIVVACGTASSVIDEKILKNTPVPIISVISPAVKRAVNLTRNNNIGVIATSATVDSGVYTSQILKNRLNIGKGTREYQVFEKSCPLFVPLVENGYFNKNNKVAIEVAKDYLKYFDDKNIDTIILGCTHYPLLFDVISNYFKGNVKLVDSGKETAKKVKLIVEEKQLINNEKKLGKIKYYVSDYPLNFKEHAEIFLGEAIQNDIIEVSLKTKLR